MFDQNEPAEPRRPRHSLHNFSIVPTLKGAFPAAPAPGDEHGQEALQVRTGAESLVGLLCEMGLCTFFGLPGGPVIPVFDAILTHPAARLIEPRHEAYGTFAAMGFYRATGKVPVVVVTAGPGATNVVTGVVAAHLEGVPMVVVCGDVAGLSTGRRLLQDTSIDGVGIERMLQGVTRAVVRVSGAGSAGSQVYAAVQAATDPARPGPALVVLSLDRAGERAAVPQVHAPGPGRAPRPLSPERGLLDAVTAELHRARRPLLIVGAGCRREAPRLLRLAETIGAPFVTTPQAKGLLPEDHPLSLRSCGMAGSLWARRYMNDHDNQGSDVTLALGTDLDDVSICATPPIGKGGALIHINGDAQVFGRNVPTRLAGAYDVGVFADELAAHLVRRGGLPDRSALLREAKEGPCWDVAGFAADDQVPIAPHRVMAELERAAGPGTTFVSDIGEHMLFALHYLTIRDGQDFVIHLGLGSMGSGISSAVGLALGDPARRVICICGDGGMQMAGMEILVAVKQRLPVIYAVFNDARYNMVYHGYRQTFGREAAWDVPMVDFVGWAEAVGARGRRIEGPGEITGGLLDELTADGRPAVLDIRHDSQVRLKGGGRVEAIRDEIGGHELL